MAADYDGLMTRLERIIAYVVDVDLHDEMPEDRAVLVGHLTGAVIVTIMDHDRGEPNAAEAPSAAP